MSKVVLNVPLIKQTKNNCVPACLAMVFQYFGYHYTQKEVADWFEGDVSSEGAYCDEAVKHAREHGLIAQEYENIGLDGIIESIDRNAPIIATIKHEKNVVDHVVVITGYETRPNIVFLNDSLLAKYTLPYKTFSNLWRIRRVVDSYNQHGIIMREPGFEPGSQPWEG